MKNRIARFIDKYGYKLLLVFTLIFLIVPAFFQKGFLRDFITFSVLTFVFIQSIFIINKNKKYNWLIVVFFLVLTSTWVEILVKDNVYVSFIRFLLYMVFFVSTIISLVKFIILTEKVNLNVIIVAVVIYLLIGILGASAALFFDVAYLGAYHFSTPQDNINFPDMLYFAFITMATVGYGDITPALPETQTFAYLLAVTGQLYLAIIIALIVGKYISHQQTSGN
jgi:voltage-gated potassium channel Kch